MIRPALLIAFNRLRARGPLLDIIAATSGVFDYLLDSGAFYERQQYLRELKGHKRKSPPITVEEYASFCEAYGKHFWQMVSLDVLRNAVESNRNYDYLVRRGVPVMGVLTPRHAPADCADMLRATKHLCIAGSDLGEAWMLERCATVKRITPEAQPHLLGVGTVRSILTEGVHSTDAATWQNGGRFGLRVKATTTGFKWDTSSMRREGGTVAAHDDVSLETAHQFALAQRRARDRGKRLCLVVSSSSDIAAFAAVLACGETFNGPAAKIHRSWLDSLRKDPSAFVSAVESIIPRGKP